MGVVRRWEIGVTWKKWEKEWPVGNVWVWFGKGKVWVWLRRKWGGGCDLEEMGVAWKTGVWLGGVD